MKNQYRFYIIIIAIFLIFSSICYPVNILYTWGLNYYGQLGDGTTTNRSSPIQIGTDTSWVKVYTGMGSTYGIKSDGTLWAWGRNNCGQLGDGTMTERHSPVQVGTDTNWSSLSCGGVHAIAMKNDSTIWAWGDNGYCQLGDSTLALEQTTPAQIGTVSNWSSVIARGATSIAMKPDSIIWGWGFGQFGNLDDSIFFNHHCYAIQVTGFSNWKFVSTSGYHTLAINSYNKLWAFGSNLHGGLGNGTYGFNTGSAIPILVDSAWNWIYACATEYSSHAIRGDCTLWGWGYNQYYQLGDGTDSMRVYPYQIGTDSTWVRIYTGGQYGPTFGMKADSSVWAWGYNGYGSYGNGTTTSSHSPVKINRFRKNIVSFSSDGYGSAAAILYFDTPTLSTDSVKATATRAVIYNRITNSGGYGFYSDTVRGICWNTTGEPTLNDSHTTYYGSYDTCTYQNTIYNLQPGTTYYVRAYSANFVGIGYGNVLEFTTYSAEQRIPLLSGWNMKSSYMSTDAQVSELMSDISDNLKIMKNGMGDFYVPSMDIDLIGLWDLRQGYQFYMAAVDTIVITGEMLNPPDISIILNTGWNMIAYLRDTSMAIGDALSTISGKFKLVKDNGGHYYMPDNGIDQIHNMKPGEGYWIYMKEPGVLTYPGY